MSDVIKTTHPRLVFVYPSGLLSDGTWIMFNNDDTRSWERKAFSEMLPGKRYRMKIELVPVEDDTENEEQWAM